MAVNSVNGQTGDVTLTASEVGAAETNLVNATFQETSGAGIVPPPRPFISRVQELGTSLTGYYESTDPDLTNAWLRANQVISQTGPSGGGILNLPGGVITLGSSNLWPNVTYRGRGMDVTTIQLRTGTNNNLLTAVQGIADDKPLTGMILEDVTLDGNSAGQTAAYYVIGLGKVTNGVKLRRVAVQNFWSTALNVQDNDTTGSGPQGRPPAPNGVQYGANFELDDFHSRGANRSHPDGDMCVVTRTTGVAIRSNCEFTANGGNANGLALQFLAGFVVESGVRISNAWRSLYLETCNSGKIGSVIIQGVGSATQATSGVEPKAIWLTTADETYPGAGYAGCSNIDVDAPIIYGIVDPNSSTSGAGIVVSGPTSNPAQYINIRSPIIGLAGGYGVRFDGNAQECTLLNANITSANVGVSIGQAYRSNPGAIYRPRISGGRTNSCQTGLFRANDKGGIYEAIDLTGAVTQISDGGGGVNRHDINLITS